MKAVINGIVTDVYPEEVLVTDESDLAYLEVPVGSIAYTAGKEAAWQLDVDGQWVQFIGGTPEEETTEEET